MRLGLSNLSFTKPNQQELEDCAEQASRKGPNHLLVGASQAYEPPLETHVTQVSDGWIEDFDAVKVGDGKRAFDTATEAVKTWQHMSLGWVETNRPPIKLGKPVCIVAKMLCFWQRNPLQISHVTTSVARKWLSKGQVYGFGQTTLKGHALAGEESFTVRWKEDDSVWYEIYAFSRARTVLAFAAYPIRRFFQHKFREDSMRKIKCAVEQAAEALD